MKYIKTFQLEYKLKPDGVIGKNTLNTIAKILNINNKEHLSHFLGQIHLETGGFHFGRESMNYTPNALNKVFGKRITTKQSWQYGRTSNQPADQKAIANIVYGGQWGKKNLGNTELNDGWLFRGNGAIQLTGRYNHQKFADYLNFNDIMQNPDLVMKKYYFQSAKFYFDKNKVWDYATEVTKESVTNISKIVNIGNVKTNAIPNHLKERIHWTFHYYTLLQNIEL